MAESSVASRGLVLRLFGPFEGEVDGRPLARLRSRKCQWLLAILALRGGAPVDRIWLAGSLWPDSDEPQALANQRQVLTDLRRVLGPEASRVRASGQRTLSLDVEGADVDALEFDRLLARGDPESLSAALTLYRGPLLLGCDEEALFQERESRAEAWLAALERLAAWHLEKGDHRRAAELLRRGAAADPYRESLQRSLMTALAGTGDYAAAIHVYRDLRSRLLDELRAEPSAETRAAFEAVRRSAREGSQASQRGLQQPPSTHVSSPPARLPRPTSLPVQLTRTVGRDDELAAVSQRLDRARLVTLVGAGGIGKTRLALEFARREEQVGQDVFFADIAPIGDPALVAPALASSLGVVGADRGDHADALLSALRSMQALLVVDNCEHVLAGCAPLLEMLVGRCPELRVLATSRQALGVPGEQVLQVPPLALPPDDGDAASLAAYPAVALFTDRASAISGFALSGGNAHSVARVCRRLEGIPLALELAAARLSAIGIDELAARLDDMPAVLSRGARTVAPRQQTLRSLMDWSVRMLPDLQRALFVRLSVFAGGCTIPAARQVCSDEGVPGDAVADALADLVDHSLVMFETGEGGGRYRMLEPVRQYARELCRSDGLWDACVARHLEWCAGYAEAPTGVAGRPSRAEGLQNLATEHDNIRAALDGAARYPEQLVPRARLAAGMWRFWMTRGHLVEARHYLDPLVADGAPLPPLLRASVTRAAAAMAWAQGDAVRADELMRDALRLAEESGDQAAVSGCLQNLANVVYSRGLLEEARDLWERALRTQQAVGDRAGAHGTLNNLANLAHALGDAGAASARYCQALALAREAGDRMGEAAPLVGLGNLAKDRRDASAAARHYTEALEIAREVGDRAMVAGLLCNLAALAHAASDSATASPLLAEALDISCELGNRRSIAATVDGIAWQCALEGRHRVAARLLGASDAFRKAADCPRPTVDRDDSVRAWEAIRLALGDDACCEASAAGARLSLEEAAAEARVAIQGTPGPLPSVR